MTRAFVVAVLALVTVLTSSGTGSAQEVVLRDNEGRSIRFDDRAGVELGWYANLLRRAAHSDEISRGDDPDRHLGRAARAVRPRRRGLLLAPERKPRGDGPPRWPQLRHRAHADPRVRPPRRREPPPRRPRRAERDPALVEGARHGGLVAVRSVRDRYQVGWDRSISEVFAEDYAYTNLHRGYKIAWLDPPSRVVQQAIRADLGLAEPPAITGTKPVLRPVVIVREGDARAERPRRGRLRPPRAEPARAPRRHVPRPRECGRSRTGRGRLRRPHATKPHDEHAWDRVARPAAGRPGSVQGVDPEHGHPGRAVPLHRPADARLTVS